MSISSTLTQIFVALGAAFGGVVAGVWYDVLYCLQAALPRPLRALPAVLFWAGAVYLHFTNMAWLEGGQLRAFPILLAAAGFCAYRASIGRPIRRGLQALTQCARNRRRRSRAQVTNPEDE